MQTTKATLIISTSDGKYFFHPEEIIRLEARSNYTSIYFSNNKKMLTAKVLKDFVPMLLPHGFVRTHRTHLVNLQHILCVTPDGKIIMKDASVAAISKRKRSNVMQTLKNAA